MEKSSSVNQDSPMNGLDLEAAQNWIFPTNYPLREYQYVIVESALYQNTLVSLPTGLGKTFIAAVLMYNFYRWYPSSKVVFMAPTKPLVKQQLDACCNVMAIPKIVTAELTGSNLQTSRKQIWEDKRVFFITPQILENDLDCHSILGPQIKCLVIDEAHKAKGNHAYCGVVRKLYAVNKYFRILALSATPGKDDEELADIVKNLLVSKLEIRTDESPDVVPYLFEKDIVPIVVDLDDKLKGVKEEFAKILEVYTRPLVKLGLINGNCNNLSKGKIFMLMKDYQQKGKPSWNKSFPETMRNFNICLTLYHGYDLLLNQGLRSFCTYFKEHLSNPLLQHNESLESIVKDVQNYLGPEINIIPLPDGSIAQIPKFEKYGHPKFSKMRDILIEHFTNKGSDSRAMVFCEYCESVREAYAILLQHRPMIKPKCFMGQSSITQRQQITIIKSFKSGECNCLISTSIGEEGLDIGELDLIVCLDISSKSPTRMIQRIGRTGRKSAGKVYLMATRGREEHILSESLLRRKFLSKRTTNSYGSLPFFKEVCRMIPENILPKCEKRHMVNKDNTLKAFFKTVDTKDLVFLEKLYEIEPIEIENRIPTRAYLSAAGVFPNENQEKIIESQTFWRKSVRSKRLRPHLKCGSVNGQILDSLFHRIELKKYNLPLLQSTDINVDQLKMVNNDNTFGAGLKQSDIRNLFMKPKELPSNCEESTKQTSSISEKPINIELHEEILNYLKVKEDNVCNICTATFCCDTLLRTRKPKSNFAWTEIDEKVIDNIDLQVLNDCISVFDRMSGELKFPSQDIRMYKDVYATPLTNEMISLIGDTLSFFKLDKLEDIYVPVDGSEILAKLWTDFQRNCKTNSSWIKRKENEHVDDVFLVENSYLLNSANTDETNQEECHHVEMLTRLDKSPIIGEENDMTLKANPPLKNTPTCRTPRKFPNLSALKKKQNFFFTPNKKTAEYSDESRKVLHSFCDMSIFGLDVPQDVCAKDKKHSLDISDVCDLSIFGLDNYEKEKCNEKISEADSRTNVSFSFKEKCATDDNLCGNYRSSIESRKVSTAIEKCEQKKSNANENPTDSTKSELKSKSLSVLRQPNRTSFEDDILNEAFTMDLMDDDVFHSNSSGETTLKSTNKHNIRSSLQKSSNESTSISNDVPIARNSRKRLKLHETSDNWLDDDDDFWDIPVERWKSNPKSKTSGFSMGEYKVNGTNSSSKCVELDATQLTQDVVTIDLNETNDDFICQHRKKIKSSRKEDKLNVCSFIDDEAEVSILISSDDDEHEDENKLESSFVDDSICEDVNATLMHNVYLQSTRSPLKNGGHFKIPELRPIIDRASIFSQAEPVANETYIEDSFCVNNSSSETEELSHLEKLEMILEMKKRKKRKHSSVRNKRKRIIQPTDDSD